MENIGKLAREVIENIEAGDPEGFLGAGEIALGVRHGLKTTSVLEPYRSAMHEQMPSEDDMRALQRALRAYISITKSNVSPSAFHALGKFYYPEDIEFFREHLERQLVELLRANRAVTQIIFGLSNHGEKIIEGGSHGITNIENAVKFSRKYLQRFGKVIPL